jgi:hypothetical protein
MSLRFIYDKKHLDIPCRHIFVCVYVYIYVNMDMNNLIYNYLSFSFKLCYVKRIIQGVQKYSGILSNVYLRIYVMIS